MFNIANIISSLLFQVQEQFNIFPTQLTKIEIEIAKNLIDIVFDVKNNFDIERNETLDIDERVSNVSFSEPINQLSKHLSQQTLSQQSNASST